MQSLLQELVKVRKMTDDKTNRNDRLDKSEHFTNQFDDIIINYLNKEHRPFDELFNQQAAKDLRIPDKSTSEEPQKVFTSPAEILAPLDTVFIDDRLKDEIIMHTAIPELLEGTTPQYSGVILYGPPGTGKTVLLEAIAEVYSRAGSYSESVSFARLNSEYVGRFAKNLEDKIIAAKEEARRRGRPSFLLFDEADILIENAAKGAKTVSKHYQEAISVLKRYIGNDQQRDVIIAISTNGLPESFEEALTREGRLTTYFIGYPDKEQKTRMWQYFTQKYEIANMKDEESTRLAELIPSEQGAFIEEFCRNYHANRRKAILADKGYATLVAALKAGVQIHEDEVRQTYSFATLQDDIMTALDNKYARSNGNGSHQDKKEPIGFKG